MEVEVVEILIGRSSQQSAVTVESNAKFHLSQAKADLYIAGIATQSTKGNKSEF